MADDITFQTTAAATPPNATVVATDDVGGVHYQKVKLTDPTADSSAAIGVTANPLRTDPTGTTAQPVTDNGGSLTVDNVALAVVGGGTEATALRVTLASDSTGVVSVDDNGGSLTVDGTVSVDDGGGSLTVDGAVTVSGSVTADTELTTADLDTGAGTDTRAVVGLALAASGGGLLVGAANPMPVSDNGGNLSIDDGGNSITVDGTVTVQDGGSTISVDDGAGSLTVDGTVTASNAAGDVAHDSADSGNPVKIGGKAQLTTGPSAVSTAGDRVDAQFDGQGRQTVRTAAQALPSDIFTALHRPSSNTQATITQSTPGAGKRLVCTSITVVLAATSSAPAAVQTAVTLVTDTGGAATELWSAVIALPATAGAMAGIATSGLWIEAAQNKDLRLRFEAAGGANTIESVAMSGVILTE